MCVSHSYVYLTLQRDEFFITLIKSIHIILYYTIYWLINYGIRVCHKLCPDIIPVRSFVFFELSNRTIISSKVICPFVCMFISISFILR